MTELYTHEELLDSLVTDPDERRVVTVKTCCEMIKHMTRDFAVCSSVVGVLMKENGGELLVSKDALIEESQNPYKGFKAEVNNGVVKLTPRRGADETSTPKP